MYYWMSSSSWANLKSWACTVSVYQALPTQTKDPSNYFPEQLASDKETYHPDMLNSEYCKVPLCLVWSKSYIGVSRNVATDIIITYYTEIPQDVALIKISLALHICKGLHGNYCLVVCTWNNECDTVQCRLQWSLSYNKLKYVLTLYCNHIQQTLHLRVSGTQWESKLLCCCNRRMQKCISSIIWDWKRGIRRKCHGSGPHQQATHKLYWSVKIKSKIAIYIINIMCNTSGQEIIATVAMFLHIHWGKKAVSYTLL